jgi:GMP synthase (glutamine-hydrolysing)
MEEREHPPGRHAPNGPGILILKTGTTFPDTRRRYGDFERWFIDSLRGCTARFQVWDATETPPPALEGYQGVIVTGSPASVYEDLPWLPPVEDVLREAVRRQDTPVLAVCFGAQVLASAMGGRVIRNPLGWEIGTVRVQRTEAGRRDPLLGGETAEMQVQATHQDFIEALPGEAVLLAANEMSPVQAFRYGDRVWGTQFHPEATPDILADLIRARRELLEQGGGNGGPNGSGRYQEILGGLAPTPEGRELLKRFVGIAAGSGGR